jgi:hypothetical protein
MALTCSVLGTRLGEKGKLFLEMGYDLYEKVQRRVESEPPSRHWQILATWLCQTIKHVYSMSFRCMVPLSNACNDWCSHYLPVKILRLKIVVTFA